MVIGERHNRKFLVDQTGLILEMTDEEVKQTPYRSARVQPQRGHDRLRPRRLPLCRVRRRRQRQRRGTGSYPRHKQRAGSFDHPRQDDPDRPAQPQAFAQPRRRPQRHRIKPGSPRQPILHEVRCPSSSPENFVMSSFAAALGANGEGFVAAQFLLLRSNRIEELKFSLPSTNYGLALVVGTVSTWTLCSLEEE